MLGGCGGIGRSVVEGARERGYYVAVLDLPASLTAHPPPEDTLCIAVDAAQDEQIAQAAPTLGEHKRTLKGCVDTCGFLTQRVPAPETAPDDWSVTLEGNLSSAFYSARHFAPFVSPGGVMVMIGSGSVCCSADPRCACGYRDNSDGPSAIVGFPSAATGFPAGPAKRVSAGSIVANMLCSRGSPFFTF